jgi:hypothetical protein
MTDGNRQLVDLIASRLIESRDCLAMQAASGAYQPHCTHRPGPCPHDGVGGRDRPCLIPVSRASLTTHVEGTSSFGHFTVSKEGKCRVIVFDIDLMPEAVVHYPGRGQIGMRPREVWAERTDKIMVRQLASEMKTIARGLCFAVKDLAQLQTAVTYSGSKGFHVMAFLDPGTAADEARVIASFAIEGAGDFRHRAPGGKLRMNEWESPSFPAFSVEVFPKQDEVGLGFGNLTRIPLGVHHKSGRPSWFVNMIEPDDKFSMDDPIVALTNGSLR